MQQFRVGIHHLLTDIIGLGSLSFDHIGGKCPRCTGKPDKRLLIISCIQLFSKQLDRIIDIGELACCLFPADQSLKIFFCSYRITELRPLPFHKREVHPHLIGDHQDITEENRRIHTDDIQGLDRYLCRFFRVVAEVEKTACLTTHCHVLRQVSSRLSHHPNRRIGRLLPKTRIYKYLTH